jgi:predicted nucleic acid-binding protein
VSYFDAAYIAKFYLDEPESDAVRRLAESRGQVHCAVLGQVEVAAVLQRE